MALFRQGILVEPIYFLFKTITGIALKLTLLIHHHYFYQHTRVHNSGQDFCKNYGPFALEFWLSLLYQFTYFQNHYRYGFETYNTYSPSLISLTDKET